MNINTLYHVFMILDSKFLKLVFGGRLRDERDGHGVFIPDLK